MVSVFEGQLTRTWFYKINNRNHVINVYHDTITGVRSAMLDFQEIKGSMGSSSLMMESKGHRIFFTLEDLPGYLEIKRSGWTGFAYACVINDVPISEATQEVASDQNEIFRPKIIETTFTPDEISEHPVAWYVVRTTRLKDNTTTIVHRRFKDFVELNSQVKQNLKGNHLRWALPPIPEKPLKAMTDHRDPEFIQDRCAKLEIYISALVAVPHVSEMICVKAFVGIMEQVREFSLSFQVPTIGMSLLPSDRLGDNTPAIVGLIQKPNICQGVLPGDSISKINGLPVAGSNFNGVVARIKNLPRPLIIHFIQVIASSSSTSTSPAPAVGDTTSSKSEQGSGANNHPQQHKGSPLPTFEGDVYDSPREVNSAATSGAPPARQTWATYDEPPAPPPQQQQQQQQQAQVSPKNQVIYTTSPTSFEEVEEVTEAVQNVRIVSVPRNVTPPPAEQLSKPLPLGWD